MKPLNIILPIFAILSIIAGFSFMGYFKNFWPPSLLTSEAGLQDIVIRARGTNGAEKIALYINDQPIEFWDLTTSFQDYTYTPSGPITINTLSVNFLNDRWEPENGINYDVQVDYITVSGETYQSEDAQTNSTGTWDQINWCAPGNKQNEWLHCTGKLVYDIPTGTVVGDVGGGSSADIELLPQTDTVLSGTTQPFTITAPAGYYVGAWIGSARDQSNYYDTGVLVQNGSFTASGLPNNGSDIYVRIAYKENVNAPVQFQYYQWTAHDNQDPVGSISISPADRAVLSGTTQPFTITAPAGYYVGAWIGSARDQSDFYDTGALTQNGSFTAENLPTDGSDVHVRIAYKANASAPVEFRYFQWKAHEDELPVGSVDLSPGNGTTLSSSSQPFTITAPAGYYVGAWIGSARDQSNYYDTGVLVQNGSFTASGLPNNGSDIYVRIAYKENVNAPVQFQYYQWTAFTGQVTSGDFDHACANPSFQYTKLTNNSGTSNSGLTLHHYPTVSAWNADDSLIYLPKYNRGVFNLSGNEIYPNIPFAVLANANIGSYFWDKSDPYKMYGVKRGGSKLVSIDIRNPNIETVIYNAGSELVIGKDQGVPDDDQTRVIVTTSNSMRILDITSTPATVVYQRSLPPGFDWAGMSHSGDYYTVVSGNGIEIFRASGTYQNRTAQFSANHSDFVTDASGVEYMAIVGNPPKLLRLSDGQVTNLGSRSGWGHISGRGPAGRMYYSFDLGGSYGQELGDIAVGDSFDNRRITWEGHPRHIRETGSYAVSQMRVAPSHRGDKLLVTISNPKNVPNTYLVQKTCP